MDEPLHTEELNVEKKDSSAFASESRTFPGPLALFERSWDFYKGHFKDVTTVMLFPAALAVLFGLMLPHGVQGVGRVLIALVEMFATLTLLFLIISRDAVTVMDSFKKALHNFLSYFWVTIIVCVLVVLGYILFVIPGIIASVWFSFSFIVFVVEGKRGFDAVKTSRSYVKGYWWPVFGRLLFLLVIAFGIGIAVGVSSFVFGFLPLLGKLLVLMCGAAFSVVFTPLSLIYLYFLDQEVKNFQHVAPSVKEA